MWLLFMKKLEEWLREEKVAPIISLGAVNPTEPGIGGEGAVFIIRGEESRGDEDVLSETRLTIYLETWVRDDSPKLQYGYERLHHIEERVDEALKKIRHGAGALDDKYARLDGRFQLMDVCVSQKTGDLDSMRPLVGTQYTLEVMLYDTQDEEGVW